MFQELICAFVLATIPLAHAQAVSPPEEVRNETVIRNTLAGIASMLREWPEAPIYHWPEEEHLEYESVNFPSEDGVPLEGWFLPRRDSKKIIIANHPRFMNRAGLASHVEPWASLGQPSGNDIDVNFIPDYKILHDAGYSILAHDFRSHGLSGRVNTVLYSGGRYEARDVIGALRYVRSREDTRDMTTHPEEFEDVRVIVTPQAMSANMTTRVELEARGLLNHFDELDEMIFWRTSLHLDQFSPIPWARSVTVPTYMYQVRDDVSTRSADVQAIFDAIPAAEKKLHWIENTRRRWDGFLHFQREPKEILDWFGKYMS